MIDKLEVRLTPRQVVYVLVAAERMASRYEGRKAATYRGAANALRSALITDGWVPSKTGWEKP